MGLVFFLVKLFLTALTGHKISCIKRFFSIFSWLSVKVNYETTLMAVICSQALEKKYEVKTGFPSPETIDSRKRRKVPAGFGRS